MIPSTNLIISITRNTFTLLEYHVLERLNLCKTTIVASVFSCSSHIPLWQTHRMLGSQLQGKKNNIL